MTNSTAVPAFLTDPGFLFWAPLATAEPTNTVTGSVFTDAWPGSWINLGATTAGNTFNYQIAASERVVAEFLDPIQWATTGRTASVAFNLASWTLSNLKKILNGGTLSVVSGTGTTQLNSYTPPLPGQEVRSMIGWESLDATVRFIAYQTLQSGQVQLQNQKAPAFADIPGTFNLEAPSTGLPFKFYTAGTVRA